MCQQLLGYALATQQLAPDINGKDILPQIVIYGLLKGM